MCVRAHGSRSAAIERITVEPVDRGEVAAGRDVEGPEDAGHAQRVLADRLGEVRRGADRANHCDGTGSTLGEGDDPAAVSRDSADRRPR